MGFDFPTIPRPDPVAALLAELGTPPRQFFEDWRLAGCPDEGRLSLWLEGRLGAAAVPNLLHKLRACTTFDEAVAAIRLRLAEKLTPRGSRRAAP